MKTPIYIKVDYNYECPTDNYLNGTTTETISTFYEGREFLYLIVEKETGFIEEVLREHEAHDGRPMVFGHVEIKFNCAENPLIAEVISDHHDDYKDADDYLYTPGSKFIVTPEGYEEFEYEYPIHPDVMYDDLKSTYNFKTNTVDLYKNINSDILGEDMTWDEIRKKRNYLLKETDAMSSATGMPAEVIEEVELFRQRLRDLPDALSSVGSEFIESSFPKTTIMEE